ncbi:MAG: NlpC/P60 family protein [Acidaminococcaceae bacterium]|jgi:lipoprotein Spr|nr:NlpC/P60 family protein [Acidaminococcaceae bacterium]
MWKKVCVCAVLAAVLPQAVTWAAYGDVISNVPTPAAVTATAPQTATPAVAPKAVAAAPKTIAVTPKTVPVPQPAAGTPETVTAPQPVAGTPKTAPVSQPATVMPKTVTTPSTTIPAKTPLPINPAPAAPPANPAPVAPKPITPAPSAATKPAPQVPEPAVPKPGLIPETKAVTPAPAVKTAPQVTTPVAKTTAPVPQVTAPAPKVPVPGVTAKLPVQPALPSVTAKAAAKKHTRTPKLRRETKKPATTYKAVYEVGDSGWKVREAQRKLRLLGYDVEDNQGHFTKEMARELKKFQKHAKLKRTGKLDEQTYEALGWGVFDKTGIQKIKARDILSTAARYKGVPYYFGGTTPRGFDCSGYVQYVFRQRGAQLTRTADTQFLEGMSVRKSQLKPGDLVFFSTYEPGASHVGIYAGNGQFWNATSSRGVMLCQLNDSYWGPRYYGARRVLATNGSITAR